MEHTAEGLDIVVTWVDDGDEQWRRLRDEYLGVSTDEEGASPQRFRDWGLLKYWFRGIDAHVPWVRRIHLVTENPVPDWLRTDHPRLNVVRHRDFIPEQYLPTFNSRAIEWNLHRIPGLSERFVYFNDDLFVLSPIGEDHFFEGRLPRAFAVSNALSVGDNISHAMLNNVGVLNRHFDKRTVIRRSFRKWFSPHYGTGLLQNLALLPWKRFTGFHNHHLALAMRRSVAQEIWEAEPELLDQTCRSRFRLYTDLNPFLIPWWSICSGEFAPARKASYGRYLQITEENFDEVLEEVASGRHAVVCVNDGPVPDFERARQKLVSVFENRLPRACSYER